MALRLAQTDAIDDGGVVQGVRNHCVLGAENRFEKPPVRVETGSVKNRVVRSEKRRD